MKRSIAVNLTSITLLASYVIDTEGVIAKKIVGPMDEGDDGRAD